MHKTSGRQFYSEYMTIPSSLILQINVIKDANLKGVLTDTKLFLLTNIKTLDSTYNELLIGSIGFSTSFTTTDYQIEWYKSPNYTYRPSFLAGDSSRL